MFYLIIFGKKIYFNLRYIIMIEILIYYFKNNYFILKSIFFYKNFYLEI